MQSTESTASGQIYFLCTNWKIQTVTLVGAFSEACSNDN